MTWCLWNETSCQKSVGINYFCGELEIFPQSDNHLNKSSSVRYISIDGRSKFYSKPVFALSPSVVPDFLFTQLLA